MTSPLHCFQRRNSPCSVSTTNSLAPDGFSVSCISLLPCFFRLLSFAIIRLATVQLIYMQIVQLLIEHAPLSYNNYFYQHDYLVLYYTMATAFYLTRLERSSLRLRGRGRFVPIEDSTSRREAQRQKRNVYCKVVPV